MTAFIVNQRKRREGEKKRQDIYIYIYRERLVGVRVRKDDRQIENNREADRGERQEGKRMGWEV